MRSFELDFFEAVASGDVDVVVVVVAVAAGVFVFVVAGAVVFSRSPLSLSFNADGFLNLENRLKRTYWINIISWFTLINFRVAALSNPYCVF